MSTAARAIQERVKTERCEVRITAENKNLFQQAADLKGISLSEFVVQSSREAAEKAILTHDRLILTRNDRIQFIEAILNPGTVHTGLKSTFREYQQLSGK